MFDKQLNTLNIQTTSKGSDQTARYIVGNLMSRLNKDQPAERRSPTPSPQLLKKHCATHGRFSILYNWAFEFQLQFSNTVNPV